MAEDLAFVGGDGTQWVYQCNRHTYEPIRARFIRHEVTQNAPLMGEFATLIRDGSKMRVISNHSPGFALGEAVRDHFAQHSDFVWCEQIATGDCLLVIVIEGQVAVDSMIPPAVLDNSAMEPIALSENPLDFFVSGDVPIVAPDARGADSGKIVFESSLVKTFTTLDRPVVPQLVPKSTYKLVPVRKALASAKFGPPITLIASAAVIACGVWFFADDISKEFGLVAEHQEVEYVDPYREYRSAIATPSPRDLIAEAYTIWSHFDNSAAFTPNELDLNGSQITLKLKRTGVTDEAFGHLVSASITAGWSAVLTGPDAILTRPVVSQPRSEGHSIAKVADLSARLIDELRAIISAEVTAQQPEPIGPAAKIRFSGKIAEATDADVRLLRVILDSRFFALDSMRITNPGGGVPSITFELSVLGQP